MVMSGVTFSFGNNVSILRGRCVLYQVREADRVIHVANGISKEENREIIGFIIQQGESESTTTRSLNICKIMDFMRLS